MAGIYMFDMESSKYDYEIDREEAQTEARNEAFAYVGAAVADSCDEWN